MGHVRKCVTMELLPLPSLEARQRVWPGPTVTCWCRGARSQLAGLLLTYCVVGRELEEVGGQDGRSEEPQENEAAHRRVPHVQVVCSQDTESQLNGLPTDHSRGPRRGLHPRAPAPPRPPEAEVLAFGSPGPTASLLPCLSPPQLLTAPSGSWAVMDTTRSPGPSGLTERWLITAQVPHIGDVGMICSLSIYFLPSCPKEDQRPGNCPSQTLDAF